MKSTASNIRWVIPLIIRNEKQYSRKQLLDYLKDAGDRIKELEDERAKHQQAFKEFFKFALEEDTTRIEDRLDRL